MKRPAVDLEELPPELRARLNGNGAAPRKRARSMSADEVRSHALRVLAAVAGLTQAERARVLRHAAKVNEV